MSIRQSSEIVRRTYFLSRPNTARACVKSVGMNFGNDHIFDMANFDETSRWMGWSKNKFSHSLSPDRRWRCQVRYRGSRRESAVARRASPHPA
jgi:hypothetical protein